MTHRKVPITYAFGRRDRVDPKFAPFGVLKVGKNLRVRKDGRLGTRHGLTPLDMTTANGSLVVYDLHEYRGRLCALGSDAGDGFPADRFEYTGRAPHYWRGTDRFGQRVTVNPFTNLREVAGIPQPAGGVSGCDAATSGGITCMAYVTAALGAEQVHAVIVDSVTDQVIHTENLAFDGGAPGPLAFDTPTKIRVVGVGSTFYVGAVFADGTGTIAVAEYTVGSSSRWSLFKTTTTATLPLAFNMCAVEDASTARLAIAYGRDTGPTQGAYNAMVYRADGTVVTGFGAFGLVDVVHIEIIANQDDDRIHILRVEGTTGTLNSWTFSGSPVIGVADIALGQCELGSLCRLPAHGAIPISIAVALAKPSDDVELRVYEQATHAPVGSAVTVHAALLRTKLLPAQSGTQDVAVVFGALVAPALPDVDQATNALFYVTPAMIHRVLRDYVRAADQSAAAKTLTTLSRDSSTGAIAWPALVDPGVDDIAMPVVSLVDFQSTARRQGVSFGELYYESGAAPSVYDGRVNTELGFGEAPGIYSLSASNDPAFEGPATMTGDALPPGTVKVMNMAVVFNVDDGSGSPGAVRIFFSFSGPLSAVATYLASASGGALTTAVVGGALRVSTTATGADVTLSVDSGTAATRLGLGRIAGRPYSGSTALRPGGTYYYTVHFESVLADQSVMLGPPSVGGGHGDDYSKAAAVTLTGDQNVVAVAFSVPHTARVAMGDALYGSDLTAVVSRTEWFPFAGVAGSIFRRSVATRVAVGIDGYGQPVSIVDAIGDGTLATHDVLYTQGKTGSESGPLEQTAPEPCRYTTATESRLINAGLGRPSLAQVSKEAFTGEPFSFSSLSPFYSQVAGPILGVRALDSARFIFTKDRIYAVTGAGPDDLGGGGFDAPVEIPSPGGISNAWAFLEAPDGLWFQLDDTKLFRIPRGGGVPTWEGVDVQDTLIDYPLITGACKVRSDNVGLFACNAPALRGIDARLVVRDMRTEAWFEDFPLVSPEPLPGGLGIDAITSYGETFAYATGGVVVVQSTSAFDDAGTYVPTEARTHPLYPFGLGGYGQISDLLLTGEFRGDGRIECRVSYDDGLHWTTLASFDLLESDGLTIGQTIQRKWALPQDITSSLVVDLSYTQGSAAGPTEGFVYNQLDVLVEAEDGLRELNPGEMA
jgi:hypothetical protein